MSDIRQARKALASRILEGDGTRHPPTAAPRSTTVASPNQQRRLSTGLRSMPSGSPMRTSPPRGIRVLARTGSLRSWCALPSARPLGSTTWHLRPLGPQPGRRACGFEFSIAAAVSVRRHTFRADSNGLAAAGARLHQAGQVPGRLLRPADGSSCAGRDARTLHLVGR
jgi:hypothetical protein